MEYRHQEKTASHGKEVSQVYKNNYQIEWTTLRITYLGTLFDRSDHSGCWLCADREKILQLQKSGSNEEMVAKTDNYYLQGEYVSE